MYVRLAFAVAAHLEPEILIVDEVLAVGDAEFQKKCLGKMSDVASRGRTVLFVSHNLDALRRTCETGVLLLAGRLKLRDTIHNCMETYLAHMSHAATGQRIKFPTTSEDKHHIIDIEVLDDRFQPISRPVTWSPVVFAIRFFSPVRTLNGAVTFQFSTCDGYLLTFCATKPDQGFQINFESGENLLYLQFDSLDLSAGTYIIGAGLAIANTQWLYNEPYAARIERLPRETFIMSGYLPRLAAIPYRCAAIGNRQIISKMCRGEHVK